MKNIPTVGKKVDVKKCIELYKSGMSMNAVGRIMGHRHSVIHYHLLRNNVSIRSQKESQRKPISSKKISEMYQSGMSAVEISKELKITYQCVYDRLAEAGVKTRSRKEQIAAMVKKGTYNSRKGKDHKNWNGGFTIDSYGYKLINVNGKYVREHRYVWELKHGKLPVGWVVHHLNGKKKDNRIENLAGMPRKDHSPKKIVEPFIKRILDLEREIKILKKRV